ncbi:MAG TPA: PQQ-binding-like beta-propeller repeat protein [Gemmatimonadaceae bacterium]|nr:PQQ-binding-like beta-propeller repeat protein [Gemmatimonadaceae bacterium]
MSLSWNREATEYRRRWWRGSGIVLMAAIGVNGGCVRRHAVPPDALGEVRTYLGTASRAPALDGEVRDDPELEWEASLGRGTLGVPAMGPGAAAVTTIDRWLYAFDPRTGGIYWRTRGETPYGVGPVVDRDHIYVGSEGRDGMVAAYELRKGKRVWRRRIGDVAAPLTLGDSLLFGSTHALGYTFALRTDDGEIAWRERTGGSVSGPLLIGSYVAIVSLTDSLFVLDAASGEIVTRVALGTSTAAPLARADDSTVVMTTPAGSVIGITIPSGRIAWRHETRQPILGTAVVALDTVFALTSRCTLWTIPIFNLGTATSRALGCNSVAPPVLTRNGVLVATTGGDIVMFDRSSGQRRWERRIGGELREAPVIVDGRVLVAPTLGPVVSYR